MRAIVGGCPRCNGDLAYGYVEPGAWHCLQCTRRSPAVIRRVFKYRDRDDLVDVEVVESRHGRFIWIARVPTDTLPPDHGLTMEELESHKGRSRAICPFPGFDTPEQAMADAVSLLNVVGEE